MKFRFWQGAFVGAWTLLLVMETWAIDPDLARFALVKENQIRKDAETLTNKVPHIVWSYFDAVRLDDWERATNLADRINEASGRYTNSTDNESLTPALKTVIWPSISEMIGTYEQFHEWNSKWLHRFGSGIIDSIPEGSVYFGGTDPGRFIISALTEPTENGKHFFVLTQNQLADRSYLEYIRKRYGQKLHLPSDKDTKICFEAYLKDAQERLKEGKLKPGEDVRLVKGHVQVHGVVSVMAINGLLVKLILDRNPGHHFYIEQSYALDWMYPYLSPHKLIFRLHHKPLAGLTRAEVEENQRYWRGLIRELVGDWLTNGITVKRVCDFSDRVFLDKNLDGFKGDRDFIKNQDAQKTFSKLCTSLAGLYAWRAAHSRDTDEKARMRNAADLAFRQAYALCPYSPEAIYGYAEFLVDHRRPDDAFQLVKTSLKLKPDDQQLRSLLKWTQTFQ